MKQLIKEYGLVVAKRTLHYGVKFFKKKYDSIAGDYYVKAQLFKRWHTNRYLKALELAEIVKANSNILDVGCDGGNFTASLVKYGSVVGLDLSKSFVHYANKTCRGLSFLIGDGQHLPFQDETFDLVTCLEVLEHVPNPRSLVAEVYRVLRLGGFFIIIIPDEGNLLWRIIWFFWERIGRGRVWKDLHVNVFNRERMIELLAPYFHQFVVRWANYHMLIVVRCKRR